MRRIAMTRRREHASELFLTLMACLSPWAFGSVEAWRSSASASGLSCSPCFGHWAGRSPDRARAICCLPSLALSALVLLALLQTVPLPDGLLRARLTGRCTAAVESGPQRGRARSRRPWSGGPAPRGDSQPGSGGNDPRGCLAGVGLDRTAECSRGSLGPGSAADSASRFSINAAALAFYSLFQALTWNGKIYGWRASPYSTRGAFRQPQPSGGLPEPGPGLDAGIPPARRLRHGRKLWPAYAATLIVAGIVVSLSRSRFIAMVALA